MRGILALLAVLACLAGLAIEELSGFGVVAGPGATRPVPIASVAKVMTAYAVLHYHPLPSGGSGPDIAVRPSEAAAYPSRMNATARRLGMTGTSYTDPSGLDPSTTSAAADQVRLGMAAMRVPALAAIVAMPTAVVPLRGPLRYVMGCLMSEEPQRPGRAWSHSARNRGPPCRCGGRFVSRKRGSGGGRRIWSTEDFGYRSNRAGSLSTARA